MFNRKKSSGLPTTMGGGGGGGGGGYGLPLGGGGGHPADGSGKAIKMDAPIVKSWKQASAFTKYSYYTLGFFIFLIFVGYRYLRYGSGKRNIVFLLVVGFPKMRACFRFLQNFAFFHSISSEYAASIWLTCHATECTLEVTPPGSRTSTVVFSRFQLHSSQAIKTDKAGNFLSIDTSKYEPPRAKKGKKKNKSGSYKGPDENGEYKSYSLKFRDRSPDDANKSEEDVPDGDFGPIAQYLNDDPDGESGVQVLHMRKFGLAQSRTRVRSNMNKVESYIKKRRQKLVIKESATLPWQGILCLVFGLMGLMLTLLIGQFWDETPKKQGGPGIRRRTPAKRPSGKQNPRFVVDTGRPSKYPPGYKKY